MIRMRSLAVVAVLTAVSCGVLPASTVTFNDAWNVPGQSDVFGNKLQFDLQSVTLTMASGHLTFDILTNFDNSSLSTFYINAIRLDIADLFLQQNGVIKYGVVLHDRPGLQAGHIYSVTDPLGQLITARTALRDPLHADYRPEKIVWMTSGVTDVTSFSTGVTVADRHANGISAPLYDILTSVNRPADMVNGQTWQLYFPLATCANDVLNGTFLVANPEPSTWALMGAGLALGTLMARRRHAK